MDIINEGQNAFRNHQSLDNKVHGTRGEPGQSFFTEISFMEQDNLTGCVLAIF
jgi:hypothetical protein